jgi:hypothetical protein
MNLPDDEGFAASLFILGLGIILGIVIISVLTFLT